MIVHISLRAIRMLGNIPRQSLSPYPIPLVAHGWRFQDILPLKAF